MDLPPFLLDHWLAAHEFATPPIRYNLAASTGPQWSVDELLALGGGKNIGGVKIGYAPPEGGKRLREAIGGFLGVDPEWVVVTTGASEALLILLCLATRPGGNIVLPAPAFSPFAVMADAWGLGVRTYTLSRDDGFRQNAEAIFAAADGDTALALVNTPHNPTGSVMPFEEIEVLAQKLGERGVPLVVDEVYHPLYFGRQSPTAASVPNAIVMGDMSKALSLAGLRMGWLVIANPDLRKRAIDARSYFTISSSPVLEDLAAHALDNHKTLLDRLSAVATTNRAALVAFMKRVSDIVAWAEPEGGTVAFPWFKDGRDSRPFCQALAAAGVLVAPGDCFGMPEHFRVGFAAQADGFGDALTIFERTLRG
ncbi:aminotransferase class I/II-fold pyridoxal phosphate-dependent enzyme [Mesorhizobium sp. IMUNJ 23232]|uniref:aminotransferase class I/II-fold pyridoxal phosphate-dependent enzyme n=1 Tax=Mesorhizobium sp. IMUNJ 23232 TaxID=3376064 RepID=UPI00379B4273